MYYNYVQDQHLTIHELSDDEIKFMIYDIATNWTFLYMWLIDWKWVYININTVVLYTTPSQIWLISHNDYTHNYINIYAKPVCICMWINILY